MVEDPSAEVQSTYSTAPADREARIRASSLEIMLPRTLIFKRGCLNPLQGIQSAFSKSLQLGEYISNA